MHTRPLTPSFQDTVVGGRGVKEKTAEAALLVLGSGGRGHLLRAGIGPGAVGMLAPWAWKIGVPGTFEGGC